MSWTNNNIQSVHGWCGPRRPDKRLLQLPNKKQEVFYHFLFDVSITNGYVLYKYFHSSKFSSIKDFRLQLAKDLIGNYCSRRRAGRSGGPIRPLQLQHFPIKVSSVTKKKRGRCVYCSQHSHKCSDTSWFCRECNGNEWLCHNGDPSTDCFFSWRKNIDNNLA